MYFGIEQGVSWDLTDKGIKYPKEFFSKTDSFLFLFERPVDAVEFVLAYQRLLVDFSSEVEFALKARAGVHLSEIFLRENTAEDVNRGAKPIEVEGVAKLIVTRLTSLSGVQGQA